MKCSCLEKRVKDQSHLKLHFKTMYKDMPIYRHRDGLVLSYLDRLYEVIQSCREEYSRVFAVRIDLHFPGYYHAYDDQELSNEYLKSFIKILRSKLRYDRRKKQSLGRRVHDVDFDYVWARETGSNACKPHFHLFLFFNGHAFRNVGRFNRGENLSRRIGESWAEALGVWAEDGIGCVYYPKNGQYWIDSNNSEDIRRVFSRASYLAKVSTKRFHDGFHVFGSSRV